MPTLDHLFANNRRWAADMESREPGFFAQLAAQQKPQYLWIGCSDSRVPANEIVGLRSGELFVHRNVANLVIHTDLNCLSVLQYAVDVLRVGHVIVCGHYHCGGLEAALSAKSHGLIDNWLGHIRDLYEQHEAALSAIADPVQRNRRFCELNIAHQVRNVCRTTVVQDARRRGQTVRVHGWVYDIRDGLLHDLAID
ncbi:MAG: carbonate dehydratase [Planctomycetaceae bacterium]|nr:carbonate dehydratase [Planctomycetaceae bacterium]